MSVSPSTLTDICTPTVNWSHNFVWTIDNFSFRSEEEGDKLTSSTFCTGNNDKWRLQLFPSGDRGCEDYVSLFLELVESGNKSDIRIKVKVCILNGIEQKVFGDKSEEFSYNKRVSLRGFPKFIEREILLNDEDSYLPNDNLTILVKMSLISESVNISDESCVKSIKVFKPELTLGQLLDSGKFADVKIVVNDSEIPAHKAILAARSDVFAAMFEHEMKEHRLIIDDFDPEVVKEFLHFIYTDTAPNLSAMADSLITAADKYVLKNLKFMCEEELRIQLSVETASKTLILADLHKSDQLKDQTLDFICAHLPDIIETQDFQDLTTTHSHLNKELFFAITKFKITEKQNSLIEPFVKLINETSSPLSWCHSETKVIKHNFVWVNKNFSSFRTDDLFEDLISPTFSIPNNGNWRLRLSPEGYSVIDYSVHIESPDLDEEDMFEFTTATKFKIGILNAKGEKVYVIDSKIFSSLEEEEQEEEDDEEEEEKGHLISFRNFIKRDELLNNARSLLPGGKLTIFCETCMVSDGAIISSESSGDVKITVPDSTLTLGHLLKSAKYADVTIVMNDIEIPAHKAILAGRSDVFAAIFEHEENESQPNHFSIADVDSQVFIEMLYFIYTDTAPNVDKMAHDLLAAADKYALPKLKLICEEALSAQLTVESASKILQLADLHKADQLKVDTIDFINTNLADVINTQAFQDLTKAHSHLNMELFQAIVEKQ